MEKIKSDLNACKNNPWNNILVQSSTEDDSIYRRVRGYRASGTPFAPILSPMGLTYSKKSKVNRFVISLEISFKEHIEPCEDGFIDKVEKSILSYFSLTERLHTVPLTSPQELVNILLNFVSRKKLRLIYRKYKMILK
ncbi:hypothetical protein TNCV_4851471 [Trichonephila clavipes]|nr:hypothetical protein TNCV_4851471 [Trichonephila clavipes]